MNLDEIISVTKGKIVNDYKKVVVNSFKTDTRCLTKDDAFIALKGNNYDGNSFINDNLDCKLVITDENIKLKNIPVIKVDNTYDTLYYLTKYKLNKYKIPVIAITGSNGKTTLKELIYNILSTKYNVLKNDGNKNNIIGVFQTINNLNSKHELVILELGMNHKKELERLSNMIKPSCAVITNIGSSHIGNLGSRKNIFKAKMEITSGLDGILIVNGDNKYLKKTNGYKCGVNYTNDLIAYNVNTYDNYLTFNISTRKEYLVKFNNTALEYIPMLLESIKVSLMYNIDINDIIKCIEDYKPYSKRLNEIKLDNYTVIDDSYNASYESMKCGLNVLRKYKGNKIIILGDMLELGKYSCKYHKKLNRVLNKIDNKIVLTVGSYTKYINSMHFNSNKDIINYLYNLDISNTTIFIKGSNSMKLSEIVDYLICN